MRTKKIANGLIYRLMKLLCNIISQFIKFYYREDLSYRKEEGNKLINCGN